ncbi:hypothetical protein PoB_001049800 [Plakobranchus ocellatus]|uniref:Uncharacterized protein n=1 Tax=Plakobranchus ocellatus TaxID=259542 RepID=A0AAV3YNZ3_9GAST|nr:hypothetical protein PoB_001049800 [Plakobranchus ocellatus]
MSLTVSVVSPSLVHSQNVDDVDVIWLADPGPSGNASTTDGILDDGSGEVYILVDSATPRQSGTILAGYSLSAPSVSIMETSSPAQTSHMTPTVVDIDPTSVTSTWTPIPTALSTAVESNETTAGQTISTISTTVEKPSITSNVISLLGVSLTGISSSIPSDIINATVSPHATSPLVDISPTSAISTATSTASIELRTTSNVTSETVSNSFSPSSVIVDETNTPIQTSYQISTSIDINLDSVTMTATPGYTDVITSTGASASITMEPTSFIDFSTLPDVSVVENTYSTINFTTAKITSLTQTTYTTSTSTDISSTPVTTRATISPTTISTTTGTETDVTTTGATSSSTKVQTTNNVTIAPVVHVLSDVTLMFRFRTEGECSALRQAPYSRYFKTSLASTLLYLTQLGGKSGSKLYIGEAQCNKSPHVVSVTFLQVDRNALLQALNSTHPFHGRDYQTFSSPIDVEFSSGSKKFFVIIIGFEEIENTDKKRAGGVILGLDIAFTALAACLCVVLVSLGVAFLVRHLCRKRRVECLKISRKDSPTASFKLKSITLSHAAGIYRGGKKGIDNPALCTSVYNDLEMTEVHLGDTDDDEDSSYYSPYDDEYSTIGSKFKAVFDYGQEVRYVPGINTTAIGVSSANGNKEHSKASHDRRPTSKPASRTSNETRLTSAGNYGLVIGLLGYNNQQSQQFKSHQDSRPQENLPYSHPQDSSYESKGFTGDAEEAIYAVPMKFPKKPRKQSRKRPSLNMTFDRSLPPHAAALPQQENTAKPSPVPPPRRVKRSEANTNANKKTRAHEVTDPKVQRSMSRDSNRGSGQVNPSFLGDEGYAAIGGSTQSFRF